MTTVAIVGASGHIGLPLSRLLLARGVGVRVLGRSAEHLAELTHQGAEARVGSVDDPQFTSQAFRGVDAVWAMLPPAYAHPDPREHQRRAGDAIAAGIQVARVQRAVVLSSIGADQADGNGPIAGLHQLEQRLERVPGLHLVHLRAGYFMENHLASIGLVKSAGINGGHFRADLALSMIATRDIAAVAAELLAGAAFTGRTVRELRGPREYTFREATTILGQAIGRPDLAYVEFPAADFRGGLMGAGFSPAMADLFVEMTDGFNRGHCRWLTPRSAASTTPTTLEAFAREVYAPAFGA